MKDIVNTRLSFEKLGGRSAGKGSRKRKDRDDRMHQTRPFGPTKTWGSIAS